MKKAIVSCLILFVISQVAIGASPKPIHFEKDYPINAVSDDRVLLSDSFWVPRLNANCQAGIPHCLKKLEETGVIGMFRALNGSKKEGRYKNNPWGCSDAYKTFEALARIHRTGWDAAAMAGAKKQIDEFIKLVAGAQDDDGFIFPYLQLYKKDYKPFSAAISRYTETYSMGHLLEMAVQHYENTGDKDALKVANRVVDCIDSSHGPGKKYDIPSGHPEIEIGLMRLYRATGDARCLRLAKYLIEKAKTVKTTWSHGRPALADDDAVGHVVAMFYLYAGMVDVAQMSGDKALMDLACRKWENIALKRTYITGSAGHRGHREGFGAAYDLPNDKAYCETCAAIAYVLWNHRMFLATGDAKYINLMERTLYNGFLSGVSLSGDRFYYPNPLDTPRGRARVPWFGCPCCPTNVVRFFPRIPTYMYSANQAKGDIYVNLFASGRATFFLTGDMLTITQKTRYPRDGKVNIAYKLTDMRDSAKRTANPRIRVRVPDWCVKPAWSFNGKPITPRIEKGYAIFVCSSEKGEITLDCDMPVVRMIAHPKVKADQGRIALMRGPLVYCFEGLDSPKATAKGTSQLVLAAAQQLKTEPKEITKGMTVDAIVAKDDRGRTITAIPYFARAYRKETPMSVWVRQKDLKPDANLGSWDGSLYRRLDTKATNK
ncbi:MAG: glycoside hydrolase family 127 protein [Phycisphaerae bacterium]|jgi:hypothetical protein|nr:glycoside hydrolase family 127 protein [Phycisphaerae bacterium]